MLPSALVRTPFPSPLLPFGLKEEWTREMEAFLFTGEQYCTVECTVLNSGSKQGRQTEERSGAVRLFPEVVRLSGGLSQCTGLEEPGGQEGRLRMESTQASGSEEMSSVSHTVRIPRKGKMG